MCAIAQSRMQGQGGFGSVFEAQWRGKPVAVKVPVYSIVSYMPLYIVHCINSVGFFRFMIDWQSRCCLVQRPSHHKVEYVDHAVYIHTYIYICE